MRALIEKIKSFNENRKNDKGFSLVELIIVIAIIAILAAVLAPQFIRFLEDGRISNDISLAANIETILNAEVADGGLGNGNTVAWNHSTGEITVTGGTTTAADIYGMLGETAATMGELAAQSAIAEDITWNVTIDNSAGIYGVTTTVDYEGWETN